MKNFQGRWFEMQFVLIAHNQLFDDNAVMEALTFDHNISLLKLMP